MHIRRYQDSDWSEVCKVHNMARPIEVGCFMPCTNVFTLEEVAEDDGFFAGECFVACINNQVVGFVCIEPPELSWLYVSPDYHRQGIGKKLVEYTEIELIFYKCPKNINR
jgi:GNAT superfamily N-acetyltransferase